MTKAVISGMPKQRIEEAAAQRQARVERGEDVIVGVNKYQLDQEDGDLDVMAVDNVKVREAQLRRLSEVRASRDETMVQASMDALTKAAAENSGNLMALSIEATRNRVTVGELSYALEKVYQRHEPVAK